MGLIEGKICTVSKSVEETTIEVVSTMIDEDVSLVSLYRGEDVSEEAAASLIATLEEKYDDIEFVVYDGGQPLYYYYISAE